MLRAVLRRQRFLGWLLCLFTLMAAVDRIPDPPVIKPHSDKAAARSLSTVHHISDQKSEPNPVRFDPSCAVRSVEGSRRVQSEPRLPLAPDLTRASDSSPPAF